MNCEWREDADRHWSTSCSVVVWTELPKGNPKLCPICGQPLTEIAYDSDAEESE
jgi:hypothetical protein